MARITLLDIAPKARRRTSKALVPIDPTRCPACGALTAVDRSMQPALLRHGGYGATREHVVRFCVTPRCRWALEVSVTEVRP